MNIKKIALLLLGLLGLSLASGKKPIYYCIYAHPQGCQGKAEVNRPDEVCGACAAIIAAEEQLVEEEEKDA